MNNLTNEEIEVLLKTVERRIWQLEEAGLTDSYCYPRLCSIRYKLLRMKTAVGFTPIEDMFKTVSSESKIFTTKGKFVRGIYEEYSQQVADVYFNGDIDKLDKLCEEEKCF